MKYLIFVLAATCAIALAQNDGRYRPSPRVTPKPFTFTQQRPSSYFTSTSSGSGSGRYRPSNDGRYVDNSGRYKPSNTRYTESAGKYSDGGRYNPANDGRYVPDDSGIYKGTNVPYIHSDIPDSGYSGQNIPYVNDAQAGGKYTGSRDKFSGDKYQGDKYQGDKYQGDKYQGDKYQGEKNKGGSSLNAGAGNVGAGNVGGGKVGAGNVGAGSSGALAGAKKPTFGPIGTIGTGTGLNIFGKPIGTGTGTTILGNKPLGSLFGNKPLVTKGSDTGAVGTGTAKLTGVEVGKPKGTGVGVSKVSGSGAGASHLPVGSSRPFGSGTGSGAHSGESLIEVDPSLIGANGESLLGLPKGLTIGSAAGKYDNRNYRIITQVHDYGKDKYHFDFETENGIFGEEDAAITNIDTKDESKNAKGYYLYTGPDNVVYRVDYTAGEDGFIPVGVHLPTPPPIPKLIQRALDYKRSIGEI